jgi:hypothetical protein
MLSQCRNECELSREGFLEKIALLSVAYFCVSTEMRFILQSREQYLSSPVKKNNSNINTIKLKNKINFHIGLF